MVRRLSEVTLKNKKGVTVELLPTMPANTAELVDVVMLHFSLLSRAYASNRKKVAEMFYFTRNRGSIFNKCAKMCANKTIWIWIWILLIFCSICAAFCFTRNDGLKACFHYGCAALRCDSER